MHSKDLLTPELSRRNAQIPGRAVSKESGNTMRLSTAADDGQPINNLPGLYATEDWVVHYWDVQPRGQLRSRQATIQLPLGYADACPRISIGQKGCVHHVRRWGVQCYTRVLQDIGFDPMLHLTRDRHRYPGGDDEEIVAILLQATHFDLPGYMIIASEEHPLLLFDPEGVLKGSYTRWQSYVGALAYILSEGQWNHQFCRLHEDRALHNQAMDYLLQALRGKESE